MSSPIKIMGIGLSWDSDYTKEYAKKLQDMGFYTRLIFQVNDGKTVFFVAYSYREFTIQEVESSLSMTDDNQKEDFGGQL